MSNIIIVSDMIETIKWHLLIKHFLYNTELPYQLPVGFRYTHPFVIERLQGGAVLLGLESRGDSQGLPKPVRHHHWEVIQAYATKIWISNHILLF